MKDNASVLDLVRLIMIHELGISEKRIFIYNQKFIISPDDDLHIYIEYKSAPQTISSRNRIEDIGINGANEVQDSNKMEGICVGLYSRGLDALNRKEEAELALHSVYAQQLMEENSLKIFRNAVIIPINEIEGATRLYRFDIEFKVQAWYNKVKSIEFFDSHEVEVRVNDGQPDMDVMFVIPDTDPTVYPKT